MKLLFGYDQSAESDKALEDLRNAGFPDDCEVLVITAADNIAAFAPEPLAPVSTDFISSRSLRVNIDTMITRLSDTAAKAAEQLKQRFPSWQVQHAGIIGSPYWVLLEEAEKFNADLIILGTSGHSGIGRILFGSKSHFVVNHARCSVRISRPRKGTTSGPARIMVGVDGSASADAAVEAVATRNWNEGTEVYVVAALDTSLSPFVSDDEWITTSKMDEAIAARQSQLEDATRRAAGILSARGLTTHCVINRGDARSILLSEAETLNADTVFVGAKGHSALERFLIGSTSAAIAAQAHCSVEIVRPRD